MQFRAILPRLRSFPNSSLPGNGLIMSWTPVLLAQVLLYALMSPAGSYSDFHIDFGGSSVWYHIISGLKVFLVAPPTEHNWSLYEQWASSENQVTILPFPAAYIVINFRIGYSTRCAWSGEGCAMWHSLQKGFFCMAQLQLVLMEPTVGFIRLEGVTP